MRLLPPREFDARSREYHIRSYDEVTKLVRAFLFDAKSTRQMDDQILNLDSSKTNGYVSFNTLRFLGLTKIFKGIFADKDLIGAIMVMQNDPQDFSDIIQRLDEEINSVDYVFNSLLKEANRQLDDYEIIADKKLTELENTDRISDHGLQRREQALLRRILFKGNNIDNCALCHRELPVPLLVAAHIVPRSKCTPNQRRDKNIVMPTCKLGCDEFFEKGYLTVTENGKVNNRTTLAMTGDLRKSLSRYEDKQCLFHNEQTRQYFDIKLQIVNNIY